MKGIHTGGGCNGENNSPLGVDAVALNTNTVASGASSLAIGIGNVASGEASFAQGRCTVASGVHAVAEGNSTMASGDYAHAEGVATTASGIVSHAEGTQTTASGYACHAEGLDAMAQGNFSHAEGIGTMAIGEYSHAEGNSTTASSFASHAEGFMSTVSGVSAHAEGENTTASGWGSHAEGVYTTASAGFAHAEGMSTTASGYCSHAEGQITTASAQSSHAEGGTTIASGNGSHAEGVYTTASGVASHAAGFGTIAQNWYQTVIGKNNVPTNTALNNTPNDDAFLIGNGYSDTARSNAFRVQYTGNVYAAGTVNPGGADYAEMFEWLDGNPQNQDRRGFFVTLDGERIRIATGRDEYVLGVVSALPAVVGDAWACGWRDMFLRDKWGAALHEWVEIPQEDNLFHQEADEAKMVRRQAPKLNPAYDATREYQPRTERAEWAAIGLVGKLTVRDDGSCKPNGYCRPNPQGMATASESGHRVLKRIDTDMVLIVLR